MNESSKTHRHVWLIEPPNGASSLSGQCRDCGAERHDFRASGSELHNPFHRLDGKNPNGFFNDAREGLTREARRLHRQYPKWSRTRIAQALGADRRRVSEVLQEEK